MDSKLKTLFLATGLSLTPVSSVAQQSIQDWTNKGLIETIKTDKDTAWKNTIHFTEAQKKTSLIQKVQNILKEKLSNEQNIKNLQEKYGEQFVSDQCHNLAFSIIDTLSQFWSFDENGIYHLDENKLQESLKETETPKDTSVDLSATFSSRTPALFGGNFFSHYPAISLTATVSYEKGWFAIWINQDLVDPKSSANLFAIRPFVNLGDFQVGAELDIQAHKKHENLIAPYGVYTKKLKDFDLSLMGGFAHFLENNSQVWIIRPGISKDFGEFSLQLYGWGVKTPEQMLYKGALGISKELLQNLTLQATYLLEKKESGLSLELKYSF